MFPLRMAYFVALFFPSYLRERKHHYCGDTLKSLKEEMWGKAKWVAWKWKRGPGGGDVHPFPSSSYCFADPWPHLFLALMCVCVGCGQSFIRDPAADVTFLPVKTTRSASHTLMYVTEQPYRKCVFPFTILPLFPIKSTKENVIHPGAARQRFSLHVSEVKGHFLQIEPRCYTLRDKLWLYIMYHQYNQT